MSSAKDVPIIEPHPTSQDHEWVALVPIPMMVMKNEDGAWGWAPNFPGKFDMTPFTHLSKIGCKKCGLAAIKGFGTICSGFYNPPQVP